MIELIAMLIFPVGIVVAVSVDHDHDGNQGTAQILTEIHVEFHQRVW